MATMLDVSRHAGVSKATVSRVLNGTGQVKESTRQKVFTAMQALGYRPNLLARSLANRTSNSIGWSSLRLTASISAVCCAGRRARRSLITSS